MSSCSSRHQITWPTPPSPGHDRAGSLKTTTRQLEAQLKKGLAPLYCVHGPEALLALEAADRIREAARREGATEREVFFAEPGVDWNRLSTAGSNLSLFASKRLVEIRVPTGKPGTEGAKAIAAWCHGA